MSPSPPLEGWAWAGYALCSFLYVFLWQSTLV